MNKIARLLIFFSSFHISIQGFAAASSLASMEQLQTKITAQMDGSLIVEQFIQLENSNLTDFFLPMIKAPLYQGQAFEFFCQPQCQISVKQGQLLLSARNQFLAQQIGLRYKLGPSFRILQNQIQLLLNLDMLETAQKVEFILLMPDQNLDLKLDGQIRSLSQLLGQRLDIPSLDVPSQKFGASGQKIELPFGLLKNQQLSLRASIDLNQLENSFFLNEQVAAIKKNQAVMNWQIQYQFQNSSKLNLELQLQRSAGVKVELNQNQLIRSIQLASAAEAILQDDFFLYGNLKVLSDPQKIDLFSEFLPVYREIVPRGKKYYFLPLPDVNDKMALTYYRITLNQLPPQIEMADLRIRYYKRNSARKLSELVSEFSLDTGIANNRILLEGYENSSDLLTKVLLFTLNNPQNSGSYFQELIMAVGDYRLFGEPFHSILILPTVIIAALIFAALIFILFFGSYFLVWQIRKRQAADLDRKERQILAPMIELGRGHFPEGFSPVVMKTEFLQFLKFLTLLDEKFHFSVLKYFCTAGLLGEIQHGKSIKGWLELYDEKFARLGESQQIKKILIESCQGFPEGCVIRLKIKDTYVFDLYLSRSQENTDYFPRFHQQNFCCAGCGNDLSLPESLLKGHCCPICKNPFWQTPFSWFIYAADLKAETTEINTLVWQSLSESMELSGLQNNQYQLVDRGRFLFLSYLDVLAEGSIGPLSRHATTTFLHQMRPVLVNLTLKKILQIKIEGLLSKNNMLYAVLVIDWLKLDSQGRESSVQTRLTLVRRREPGYFYVNPSACQHCGYLALKHLSDHCSQCHEPLDKKVKDWLLKGLIMTR